MLAASARAVAILGCIATFAAPAAAHETEMRGLVLATVPPASAVVRHGPLLGRPGGITTFRIVPATALATLHAGAEIDGTVDGDASPPTLSAVHTLGKQALTGAPVATDAPRVLRDVHHVVVGDDAPAPRMLDQRGRAFSLHDLAGGPVVLAFVYTRCRDARECPLTSAKFRELQRAFAGSATHLVLVTLDPDYDTPAVLARYATTFGADPERWRLATGDPDTVLDFAAAFDVTAFPDQRAGLIHPERTVILDRNGVVRDLIDESSWAPNEIVAAVRSHEHVQSNPFARLNLWLSAKAVAMCGNAVAGFSGFTDLIAVIAIVAVFAFLLVRLARSIARGAT